MNAPIKQMNATNCAVNLIDDRLPVMFRLRLTCSIPMKTNPKLNPPKTMAAKILWNVMLRLDGIKPIMMMLGIVKVKNKLIMALDLNFKARNVFR